LWVPLCKDKIRVALSKPSRSSAPGPEGVSYSVWKKITLINPTMILELLSPLVAFSYHPPSINPPTGSFWTSLA